MSHEQTIEKLSEIQADLFEMYIMEDSIITSTLLKDISDTINKNIFLIQKFDNNP
jgi:hypothetical protein